VLNLGPVSAIETPVTVTMSYRAFVVDRVEDNWLVFPERCPHQLGPLKRSPNAVNEVQCAWHGYRFDVQTGECLTGSACRLGSRPKVRIAAGELNLHW
jgi:nitrite reductase/ring-hydroxylating ferredoxin subunit